ncbi:Adenosylmethionine-8-amino-7-oxononanoate transaminase [Hibiscus syriacus]|uniref:Adenosylmethionine-8-amino-7-oxononanoate transaminase n=1 Tax=Hibiscus syriacus TaxID=106335 RepID=A0A6A2Y344_HIBSY|nr:Adenosylmethionine-8-amino-7-oxononanoate transaminase [Hibiscus syriacus]
MSSLQYRFPTSLLPTYTAFELSNNDDVQMMVEAQSNYSDAAIKMYAHFVQVRAVRGQSLSSQYGLAEQVDQVDNPTTVMCNDFNTIMGRHSSATPYDMYRGGSTNNPYGNTASSSRGRHSSANFFDHMEMPSTQPSVQFPFDTMASSSRGRHSTASFFDLNVDMPSSSRGMHASSRFFDLNVENMEEPSSPPEEPLREPGADGAETGLFIHPESPQFNSDDDEVSGNVAQTDPPTHMYEDDYGAMYGPEFADMSYLGDYGYYSSINNDELSLGMEFLSKEEAPPGGVICDGGGGGGGVIKPGVAGAAEDEPEVPALRPRVGGRWCCVGERLCRLRGKVYPRASSGSADVDPPTTRPTHDVSPTNLYLSCRVYLSYTTRPYCEVLPELVENNQTVGARDQWSVTRRPHNRSEGPSPSKHLMDPSTQGSRPHIIKASALNSRKLASNQFNGILAPIKLSGTRPRLSRQSIQEPKLSLISHLHPPEAQVHRNILKRDRALSARKMVWVSGLYRSTKAEIRERQEEYWRLGHGYEAMVHSGTNELGSVQHGRVWMCERVPVEPFFDSTDSIVQSSPFSFLVPTSDHDGTDCCPQDDVDPKLATETNEFKAAGDLFFFEIDPFIDFEYQTMFQVQHDHHNAATDSLVPVQTKPVINNENRFEIEFCRSKPPAFGFQTRSLSHSVSSSSLDIGLVPDGNSMSDMSYSFGRTMTDSSGPMLATATSSQAGGMDREARVLRYRDKRKNRKFEKTIRYASRKAYAESRPRIKGRFAKRTQTDNDVDIIFNSASAAGFMSDTKYGIVPSF